MEARWPSGTLDSMRQRQAVVDGPAQTFRDCGSAGVIARIGQTIGAWEMQKSISPSLRFGGFVQSCPNRSEEHTSELQSLMRISYAVFCLQKQQIKYTKK